MHSAGASPVPLLPLPLQPLRPHVPLLNLQTHSLLRLLCRRKGPLPRQTCQLCEENETFGHRKVCKCQKPVVFTNGGGRLGDAGAPFVRKTRRVILVPKNVSVNRAMNLQAGVWKRERGTSNMRVIFRDRSGLHAVSPVGCRTFRLAGRLCGT